MCNVKLVRGRMEGLVSLCLCSMLRAARAPQLLPMPPPPPTHPRYPSLPTPALTSLTATPLSVTLVAYSPNPVRASPSPPTSRA